MNRALVLSSLVLGSLPACESESGGDATKEPEPAVDADAAVAAEAPSPGPQEPSKKEPEPLDEAACTAFTDHMAVISAQSFGAPAKLLYSDAEKARAVEHCQRFAHSRVLDCAADAQVWNYFTNCLHARSLARPRLQTPSREDCERFRDRSIVIGNAVQTKAGGYPSTSTPRSQARAVESCLAGMTTHQVECGIEAQSQLDMMSCFSPYTIGDERTWPTAEECEDYADHLGTLRMEYATMPFPKPVEVNEALQKSSMASYMMPTVVRPQLVNLCHALDRDMVQCHTSAFDVVGLGACVP